MLNLTSYLTDLSFHTFKYWFVPVTITTFNVYDTSSKIRLFSMTSEELTNLSEDDPIHADWVRYTRRPEYCVVATNMEEDAVACYEKTLIGCILLRSKQVDEFFTLDPDDKISSAHRAIDWLRTSDFYTAPASTRYHDCCNSGLLLHSLRVADRIRELCNVDSFSSVPIASAVLVSLLHDWCKIGLYESYLRNVKDDNGKWVQKSDYRYREKSLTCFGHGVSSMFLAQKFFRLSLDEAIAIRWHMGYCRVVDSEMNELQQANETYPLVHMLQFADQLSITQY